MSNERYDEQTVAQLMLRQLAQYVPQRPPVQVPKRKGRPKRDTEQLVLLLSDIHCGRKTKSYDSTVMWQRAQRLIEAVVEIADIRRAHHTVDTIHLLWLGDIIQHERVGKTVEISSLETTVIDQIYQMAIPLGEYIIDALLDSGFATVRNYGVGGNHGRYGKRESDPTTNWDTVVYQTLRLRYAQDSRVGWQVATKSWYLLPKISGIQFFCAHGDQVRMYNTTPIYGLNQRVLRLQDSLETDIDIFAFGHFHVSHYWIVGNTRVLVNGTWVSDDDWVLKTMGLVGSTTQWLIGIHNGKVAWQAEIYLDERR